MNPDRQAAFALRMDQALLALVLIMLVAANVSIAVSQIALGLSLVALILRRWPGGSSPQGSGLGRWVFLLALWAALMIPRSGDPAQSLLFYRRFYLFAVLWTAGTAACGEVRLRWLLGALLAGGVGISVWGQVKMLQTTGALFSTRLGEMSNPMTSGCLLMLTLLVAGGVLLAPGQSRRLRWIVALAALPVLVGLVQTVTRGAWLGLAAGALVMLLTRPRLLAVCAAAAVAVVTVVVLTDAVPASIAKRFDPAETSEAASTARRFGMWEAGLRMAAERPLTGMGDRDLAAVLPRYLDPGETKFYGHLHSNPVMLLAIWGVPGFLLASGLLGAQLWLLVRWWRRLRRGPGRAAPMAVGWVLGAVGAWSGFAVAGLAEWYFGDAESMLLYLAVTGIALGAAPAALEDSRA